MSHQSVIPLKTIGLLGGTSGFATRECRERYGAHGIEVLSPDDAATTEVERVIFDELCLGRFLPSSKEFYRDVIETMRRGGANGVVLGCTEIKLLISQADMPDFPLFDTTTLHCQKAVELSIPRG